MKRSAIAAAFLAVGLVPLVAALVVRHPAPAAERTAPGPYRGSKPPAGLHAPDFRLRSYTGKTVQMRKLRGKVVLVTFLDTKCKEKCPIITGEIGRALPRLPAAQRGEVVALAISVDPETDTPASIRRFLRRRHALGELNFLTGPVAQLRPVWKAYGILPAVDTGNADVHSADVRVFDRRGVWVSTLHTGVDLTAQNLVHDALEALRRS